MQVLGFLKPRTLKKMMKIALFSVVMLAGCSKSEEHHAASNFYDDALVISSEHAIRQSVLYYPTDDLTKADLENWYYNYINNEMLMSAVIVKDKEASKGIYCNVASKKIYTDITLVKREDNTYTANITSAKKIYEAKDKKLTLISGEEDSSKESIAPIATPKPTSKPSTTEKPNETSKPSATPKSTTKPSPSPSASSKADKDKDDDTSSDNSQKHVICDADGERFESVEAWQQHVKEAHGGTGSYHMG